METKHITKANQTFIIRQPQITDAKTLIDFVKIIFTSTDQIITTIEEFNSTVEQQEIWIKSFSEKQNALILIAELNKEVVGLINFSPNQNRKTKHVGEFGMSVHPNYRGQGIGRELIDALLVWVSKNTEIEKIILKVFSSNSNALHLYKSIGFIQECIQIRAIKQLNGNYVDLIGMYKFIK